jgi:hypothetical protein
LDIVNVFRGIAINHQRLACFPFHHASHLVTQIIRDGYPATVKSQFEVHGVVIGLREAALGDYHRPTLIMLLAVLLLHAQLVVNDRTHKLLGSELHSLLLSRGCKRQLYALRRKLQNR